ncbi:epidermal growth factor receptor substrate 15 isoform X2 [Oreochromis niloticus]|uniref:epidermal growth factor receptor substrate 15 isoform X2 n=1 Tax=Oreochromis niloticus TaxID=8128 RepID=UPI000394022F|nr:epidermal growth factor receptor substrate 15 isoform X2 [Oreochromis niloticus]XP_031599272.1 epidermal growth factor receptor substrate 15 isoform X2 [Oreochromis aureus]
MASSLSLTQLSSGNPIYDKYYRQVDPTGSGRVAAADAALFLKRSGLADLVLGKIWDLADSERKGALNKQQFFIALRLVACAQNGLEVALKSLNVAVPPPKFHDTSSPLLAGGGAADLPWVVKPEEKLKFDSIFDSLGPVGGMLSGEKVKPVLLNSKLPVDILGRVWELSDIDRDGMLDRDEFSVAMYLVYRALEGEPVPMSLPPPLVPPSKRKKPSVPPVMPLLPSPPSVKDSRSSHAGSKTMPHPPKPTPAPAPVPAPAAAPWVVSPAEKAKFDELFNKTDGDMDGLVSGPEVRDIFLKTGLPSATLARIWELCDIGDIGKLTREQFALALYLINLKLTKGLDPPQNLSPEMIPPSDRQNIKQNNAANLAADFSAIKELDSLSNEIVELQREKSSVEEEIKEKEEAIRQRSNEVQDLQDEVAKENEVLQQLQAQRQKVQDALDELDQQKASLEEQLTHIRQQTNQETQLISSLQSEHEEQEQRICQYEEELVQAREELLALQEESRKLQEKVQAAQEQLTPLQESVRDSFTQVAQVQQKLNDLQVEERSVTAQLSWKRALEDSSPVMVNGSAGPAAELHHGDLFQRDLFQEDLKELRVEEHSDSEERGGVNEKEEEDEKEEESPKAGEDEKQKRDALDDLYTDMYSLSSLAKPRESNVREHSSPAPDVSSEATEDAKESPKETPPKVASPEPESKQEPTEPTETTTSPSPPQPGPRSLPPQGSPPSLPEMDFFHSDPFTDHDPFKEDPFGKADVGDPFGGDPFKGSDPFAADTFFTQTSSTPFSSEDPFSASADPFGTTSGVPEPDLFAAKVNDTAAVPAGPDPFASKSTNPAAGSNDPFSSKGNNTADSDPFGGKMSSTKEADPFGSQDGDKDPFSSSPPSSDLAVKDTAASNDPFAPGGTTVSASSDADPFAAVFGNESFGGGFADFSALAKSNGADQFGVDSRNLFQEESQPASSDVPPALPPKTGTPTRPPPPPPGKKSSINRTESSDSFHRRGNFMPQTSGDFSSSSSSSSLPAKDPLADPFAPSSPPRRNAREADGFASFDKYPTEEDMIEWAKRESEREEKERLARLTQQEQEDLELAIALSKSEFS